MERLTPDAYLDLLASESRRFREVLADCDSRTPVPGCPGWDAADLAWHLTRVQAFWAWIVDHRPERPTDRVAPERPSAYDDLLTAFDQHTAALQAALADADPADQAWTWAEDQSVGFVLRRQALEALVHRIDAEQTAGTTSPLDVRLAADGVDEVLDVMVGAAPEWASFSPLPHHLRLDITDADASVWVQLGRVAGTDPDDTHHDDDGLLVVTDPGVEPDAVISGEAAPLLTRLWRRGDGAEIHLAGDLAIVDRFRQVIHQPL